MGESPEKKSKKNIAVSIWEKIFGKKETPEELARKMAGKSGDRMDWLTPGH